MAGYLPSAWRGKRVSVYFNTAGGIEARVVDQNDGGMNIEVTKEGATEEGSGRRVFVPWTAVRYVERLDESQQGEEDDLLIGRVG